MLATSIFTRKSVIRVNRTMPIIASYLPTCNCNLRKIFTKSFTFTLLFLHIHVMQIDRKIQLKYTFTIFLCVCTRADMIIPVIYYCTFRFRAFFSQVVIDKVSPNTFCCTFFFLQSRQQKSKQQNKSICYDTHLKRSHISQDRQQKQLWYI